MKKITFILFLFLINCGDTAMLKDPFRVQITKYENKNIVPILHSSSKDDCSVLLHKRYYNLLFVLPLNQLSGDEIEKIKTAKSIRYKKVMLVGDIFLTTLGFLASFITYSLEVEDCKTNYLVMNQSDLDKLSNTGVDSNTLAQIEQLKSEITRLERELQDAKNKEIASRTVNEPKPMENVIEIPDVPILTGYSQYIKHNLNPKTQDYIVVFENNKKDISKEDKNKISEFAVSYKKNFSQFKILLIGHADWKGDPKSNVSLSLERVQKVKEELISHGISELKIFTTASGSYWPGNSEEKSGREFNRRVDMLFLE